MDPMEEINSIFEAEIEKIKNHPLNPTNYDFEDYHKAFILQGSIVSMMSNVLDVVISALGAVYLTTGESKQTREEVFEKMVDRVIAVIADFPSALGVLITDLNAELENVPGYTGEMPTLAGSAEAAAFSETPRARDMIGEVKARMEEGYPHYPTELAAQFARQQVEITLTLARLGGKL